MRNIHNSFTLRSSIVDTGRMELRISKFSILVFVLAALIEISFVSMGVSVLLGSITLANNGTISTASVRPLASRSEIRGVFIHSATWNTAPNWTLIGQTLTTYKIQAIFGEFLTVHMGGYYFSNYSRLTQYGDQLGLAIAALHPRGIEVYVSMDCLLAAKDSTMGVVDASGSISLGWTCPTRQASRTWIKTLVEDLVSHYDIDGFMFDYIRYNTVDMCFCDECRAKFISDTGLSGVNWPTDVKDGGRYRENFLTWRSTPVTELVRDMRIWMLTIKPNLKFTAAVFTSFQDTPVYWKRWIGQDTANWISKGYLDFVAPMMYTASATDVEDEYQSSRKYFVGGPEGKIPILAFISTGVSSAFDPANFTAVFNKVRSMNADGWIIWSYGGPGCYYNFPDIRNYLSLVTLPDVFSISNLQSAVNKSSSQATISWTTDLPASSRVEYNTSQLFIAVNKTGYAGIPTEYWQIEHRQGVLVENLTQTKVHSISFAVVSNQTYYCRIQSEGSSGLVSSYVFQLSS